MRNSTTDVRHMADLIAGFDWASTPLGATERWPQSLRNAVDLMLASGHAMQLAWGPERTVLYNDAYVPMLGDRHPAALGLPFREAWPGIWEQIAPLVDRVFAGETVSYTNLPLVMTRHGYPEDTWWDFSYSPVRDESGAVGGLLNVTADATARIRAERAEHERELATSELRLSEERQSFLLRLTDVLRPLDDPIEIKAAAAQLLGVHLRVNRAFYADAEGDTWLVSKGYEAEIRPLPQYRFDMSVYGSWIVDRFRAGQGLVVADMATDGRFSAAEKAAHLNLQIGAEAALPLVKGGRLVAMMVMHNRTARSWAEQDLLLLREVAERSWVAVERARAEAALREGQEHQAFLLKLSDAIRPLADPLEIQEAACRVLGEHTGASRVLYGDVIDEKVVVITANYLNGIGPIVGSLDAEAFGLETIAAYKRNEKVIFSDAATDPRFSPDERVQYASIGIAANASLGLLKDGRWVAAMGLHNATPREWSALEIGLLEEVAERTWAAVERARTEAALRDSERELQLLVGELQHRTRNLIGVIRSLSDRTAISSSDLTDYGERFRARLGALGRAQGLLSQLQSHDRVAFDLLLRTELQSMGADGTDRVALRGPAGVRLKSSTVQLLALAIHELATNAAKYGALATPEGRLQVDWSVQNDPRRLRVLWRETGVAMPVEIAPSKKGGGRELIETALAYQLQADTTFDLGPGGLVCTIEFPISQEHVDDQP